MAGQREPDHSQSDLSQEPPHHLGRRNPRRDGERQPIYGDPYVCRWAAVVHDHGDGHGLDQPYLERQLAGADGEQRRPDRARRVILPFPPAELESIAQLVPDSSWIVPQRGANSRLVDLADQNARHLLESFRLESFETEERVEDPVYALGRDLGLTTVPRIFICVDISTCQHIVYRTWGKTYTDSSRRYTILW